MTLESSLETYWSMPWKELMDLYLDCRALFGHDADKEFVAIVKNNFPGSADQSDEIILGWVSSWEPEWEARQRNNVRILDKFYERKNG